MIIDREAREIICLVASVRPFVCLCVCVCVYALLFKPFDLWPWFLAWGSTLTLARLGLSVKVVGQSSRSNDENCDLRYACGAEGSIYGLGLPSAKENHHDTWNTAQELCLFVSNQETFTIKSCAQRSGAFNLNRKWVYMSVFLIRQNSEH